MNRTNCIFADSVSVHYVPCVEHLPHVGREKGTSKPNCQAFDRINGRTLRWTPQPRSSRCKGSSLSALGACQSSPSADQHMVPTLFSTYPYGRYVHLAAAHSGSFCTYPSSLQVLRHPFRRHARAASPSYLRDLPRSDLRPERKMLAGVLWKEFIVLLL